MRSNAALGLLRLHTAAEADVDPMLARIQNELFDLGADLCVPGEGGDRLRLEAAQSARLDAEIAGLNAALPPLRSFVLPGGSPAAAAAHLARTVTRRAERLVVALAAEEALNPEAVRYLNRLSDHVFRAVTPAERQWRRRCAVGARRDKVAVRPGRSREP